MSLPTEKDLSQLEAATKPLKGPGLKGSLNFKAEKSEYLFSLTIEKSKTGQKYKLVLTEDCKKDRATASEEHAFQIGTFKGIKQELLTEFLVNRHQVEGSDGALKFKYFQIAEDHGKKKTSQVSCVPLIN